MAERKLGCGLGSGSALRPTPPQVSGSPRTVCRGSGRGERQVQTLEPRCGDAPS